METLRLGHAMADHQGIISNVDPIFCELLGMDPADVIGRHVHDITHPDDRGRNIEAIERLLDAKQPYRIDKRYVRRDGSTVRVRNYVSLFCSNEGQPRVITAAHPVPANDLDCDLPDRRNSSIYDALDRLAEVVVKR